MKQCYHLCDLDRDNELNLLNLLHLYKNIPKTSAIGLELLTLIEYHIQHNIKANSQHDRIRINFEIFNQLLPKFSLREEIRTKFCGIGVEDKLHYHPWHLSKELALPIEQLRKYDPKVVSCFTPNEANQSRTDGIRDLLDNIEVIEDTTKGLFNFRRNLDRLCNKLLLTPMQKFSDVLP